MGVEVGVLFEVELRVACEGRKVGEAGGVGLEEMREGDLDARAEAGRSGAKREEEARWGSESLRLRLGDLYRSGELMLSCPAIAVLRESAIVV